MKYTKLGNSDLNVSRICMGCMGFGDSARGQHSWTIDEEHTRQIIKRGLDLGVSFYDTAIAYQSGTSEQYLGRALRDFAKRDEVVVATKFLPRTPDEIEKGISGQQHIENMLNTSLSNLGMDYVDLYIYHMWDWQTPIEDIMDGLNRIVKAGKARYIGISNCFAWQLAKANAFAEKEGFAKFVSVQGHYNLIFREEEREMVPFCEEENIALTPYSALASGRLSRKPGVDNTKRASEDAYAKFKYDATAEQDNIIIARVAELAEKHGVTMTEISLAWLLTKVTSPVVGATKLHHIEGAAKSVDLELTDEELSYLEEPYVPHPLAGVMAQNKPSNAGKKHVWSTGDQKIKNVKWRITMKRIKSIFALTLALLLILSLAACGGNTKTAETTAANTNEKSAVQETDKQATESGTGETTSGTSKVLVAYFSATGTTKGVAEKIASLENADLYEIVPAQPYSDDDLNWHDSNSRSTIEQNDKTIRPEIGSDKVDLSAYDTIYLGFPIWWGEEPRIMDTFVESYDFTGKTVIPFCTSGSSGIGNSGSNLATNAGSGDWKNGDRLDAGISDTELQSWIDSK